MGEINLELIVSNINDSNRQHEISFLVDTGATRAWLPQENAESLGISHVGSVPVELADETIKEYPFGFCYFTFAEETIAGNVIIAPANTEPLVGTHVLQDFRLVIDLERHTISRSRAMRAKLGLA